MRITRPIRFVLIIGGLVAGWSAAGLWGGGGGPSPDATHPHPHPQTRPATGPVTAR